MIKLMNSYYCINYHVNNRKLGKIIVILKF